MAICKNCGKPLILYKGKCVYCGAEVNAPVKTWWYTDIVFCIDCSSSMASVIDYIKRDIHKLVKGLESWYNYDWRAKVDGYYDVFIPVKSAKVLDAFREKLTILDNPFVKTSDGLEAQLDGIKAQNVYVNEESPVVDMVRDVLNTTKWCEKCEKYILLFTDKTAKETCDEELDQLGQKLKEQHVILLLWGRRDSFYDKMMKIPYSDIVQFDDPKAYYCNDNVNFGQFMARQGLHT